MSRIFLPNKGSHSRVLSSKGAISGGGGFGDVLLGSVGIGNSPPIIRGTGLGNLPEKIGDLKLKSVGRKHKNINFNL